MPLCIRLAGWTIMLACMAPAASARAADTPSAAAQGHVSANVVEAVDLEACLKGTATGDCPDIVAVPDAGAADSDAARADVARWLAIRTASDPPPPLLLPSNRAE